MASSSSNVIYGKGDVCLRLNPFDNYRMFTLYDDWTSDDRKPLDLSNGQKMYLIFKSKNKEIRIPECSSVDVGYSVDKVNGQVLFKINQKNAIDILAMDSNVFYITRVYETTDMTGETVISSDEEVMYTGKWKDDSSNTVENYTAQIKEMKTLLEDRNTQISNLQQSNAELIEQNVNFATQIEELKTTNDELESQVTELENKLADYESNDEYDGQIISTNTEKVTVTTTEGINLEKYAKALEDMIKS
jgi:polyhydroxyalkanoate synthesis regulator phasin